jgi:hypothetical protein
MLTCNIATVFLQQCVHYAAFYSNFQALLTSNKLSPNNVIDICICICIKNLVFFWKLNSLPDTSILRV